MKSISIDIETYSSVSLQKAGVYKYAESEDFTILLFGYSVDGGEVKVIDLANGEQIPAEILSALSDDSVEKWAFNAQFERVCLSNYLGNWLEPDSWHCTMVWAATLGLPLSLEGVGAVLWGLRSRNWPKERILSDISVYHVLLLKVMAGERGTCLSMMRKNGRSLRRIICEMLKQK